MSVCALRACTEPPQSPSRSHRLTVVSALDKAACVLDEEAHERANGDEIRSGRRPRVRVHKVRAAGAGGGAIGGIGAAPDIEDGDENGSGVEALAVTLGEGCPAHTKHKVESDCDASVGTYT